jgi:hypothetical protein
MAGWTVGVGWWTARMRTASKITASNEMASNNTSSNKAAAIPAAATAVVLLGLVVVPLTTGLKTTPILEWIGAVGGLGLGYILSHALRTTYHAPS